MQEILRIGTADWELAIWCSSVVSRQKVLARTLKARRRESEGEGHSLARSEVRFSQALEIISCGETVALCPLNPVDSLTLTEPLFFENLQYQFEWIFNEAAEVSDAQVQHKLKLVNDAFRFSSRRGLPVLNGLVQTGNNVGWLRLPIQYMAGNRLRTVSLSLEVLPVKMDLAQDLPSMYRAVDSEFLLWRFSLAQKTEQESGKGKQRGNFPLLWLARFEVLRKQLTDGLGIISHAPHRRLVTDHCLLRAERIKGRVGRGLAEKVFEDNRAGIRDRRYVVEHKQLSVDTPENRFLKMVVSTTKRRLEWFHRALVAANSPPEKQLLSDAFLAQLKSWQAPLVKFQGQHFYREIGGYAGINGESLVLQQKTGYSAVYRVWQELKFYLDVFGNQDSVPMKSVAEIYEIWCFLEIRRMLLEDLGFGECSQARQGGLVKKQFEVSLKDGFGGAFEFKREDGIHIRLAHEQKFTEATAKDRPIRTWTVNQEPDIFLEARFPDGHRFVWLFDAKYRIRPLGDNPDTVDYEPDTGKPDLVPDDAINQMHRYRDALVYLDSANGSREKSRPVFGAYALYPGFFDQKKESNPYQEAIDEIGIGAFSLLPSVSGDGTGNFWLKEFLTYKLGVINAPYPVGQGTERLYVQDGAPIPRYGMTQVLYPDLVMTVPVSRKGRSRRYIEGFEKGTARWYHIPENTFSARFSEHVVSEIAYLAVATTGSGAGVRRIKRVWRVKSVCLRERNLLTEEQAGASSSKSGSYWLFELCEPFVLESEIEGVPFRNVKQAMKLTTIRKLARAKVFNEINVVYDEALS